MSQKISFTNWMARVDSMFLKRIGKSYADIGWAPNILDIAFEEGTPPWRFVRGIISTIKSQKREKTERLTYIAQIADKEMFPLKSSKKASDKIIVKHLKAIVKTAKSAIVAVRNCDDCSI